LRFRLVASDFHAWFAFSTPIDLALKAGARDLLDREALALERHRVHQVVGLVVGDDSDPRALVLKFPASLTAPPRRFNADRDVPPGTSSP
jgi:hypothetical protein